MKKLFLALAVVGLFSFGATSCSSEEKASTEHHEGDGHDHDHEGHDHDHGDHDH